MDESNSYVSFFPTEWVTFIFGIGHLVDFKVCLQSSHKRMIISQWAKEIRDSRLKTDDHLSRRKFTITLDKKFILYDIFGL